ncbi:MAG TPA: hypothetical protein IGS53_07630 [Leptolyngbyaceae cyanobacterium M33_DOE_097]|uniref:O-antigen ligase domain-containing protein n=1 Tax=Oscillatoriales cyanobacterium SpSt-418 TaxID=2282169 RepID=A0A7C3PFF1_9CYAN|nr:hypothetical protein [Leptolyngbyaceae cyanobacterium M33_DOE_097]
MSTQLELASKQKGYVSNSNLTLFGVATALFPRVLSALKFPSAINFLHFVVIPFACGSVLWNSRSKDAKQVAISKSLLIGLFLFLISVFASALLNDAGVINAVLVYLLLAEPFILILTIVCIPMTVEGYERFRKWILQAALINMIFAYVQKYVFRLDKLIGLEDNVKGIFIGQGAGHVLGGSVAMTFAVYYFVTAKSKPLWFRIVVVLACFNHILISDTKQVLLSFIVGYVLLYLINVKDIKKTITYLVVGAVFLGIFYWAIYNFEALKPFTVWIRPEIYGPDGEATKLKFAAFRLVPQYFESPFNWLFGLGPGHTVGRLGGWMLDSYWNLLAPLGATRHPVSWEVWGAVLASWLGDQSSLFSPLFGWAGIWGDLGFVGLGTYFYMASVVWRHVCVTDLSKYLMLTVFAFALVLSQLEEPGYTLFVASMIGLGWQDQKIAVENQK